MMNNIPTPPALMGTEAQQISQMRSYLFRISEMLNSALTEQNVVLESTKQQVNHAVSDSVFSEELDAQYSSVKSLIVKTADIVRSEFDLYVLNLSSNYIAKSEWGTYEEQIQSDITVGAEAVLQEIGYESTISDLKDGVADFEEYKIQTNGYIQSGIIGYGGDNVPIIGIAIGQDLTSEKVTIDGTEYNKIDMTKNLATYTSERITFWQNGREVAYISNSEMGITAVHITGKMTLGDNWEISHANGFAIRWIETEG